MEMKRYEWLPGNNGRYVLLHGTSHRGTTLVVWMNPIDSRGARALMLGGHTSPHYIAEKLECHPSDAVAIIVFLARIDGDTKAVEYWTDQSWGTPNLKQLPI
mgnify:CR=1 FL=1